MDANVSPSGESRGGTAETKVNSGAGWAALKGNGRGGGLSRGRSRGRGRGHATAGVGKSFKGLLRNSGQEGTVTGTPDPEAMDTGNSVGEVSEGPSSSGVPVDSGSGAGQEASTDQVSRGTDDTVQADSDEEPPSGFEDDQSASTVIDGTRGTEDPETLGVSVPLRALVAECVRACEHRVPEELCERMAVILSGDEACQLHDESGHEHAMRRVRDMLNQRQGVREKIISVLARGQVSAGAVRVAALLAALPQLRQVGPKVAFGVDEVKSQLSTLNWKSLEERKGENGQRYGNTVYIEVSRKYPLLAGEITGLLMELYDFEISHLLADSWAWDTVVAEAISTLTEKSLELKMHGPAEPTEGQQGMDCEEARAAEPEVDAPQVGLVVCVPVQLVMGEQWQLFDEESRTVLKFPEKATVGDLVDGGHIPWRTTGEETVPCRVLRVVCQGVVRGVNEVLAPGEVLLCLAQSGELAEEAEDEPDPSAIPYTHIEQALRWTIKPTPNIQRGCVLSVRGDTVSVLIGVNKVVSAKNTQKKGPQVGESLYLRKRTTILSSDEMEVEYVMVRAPPEAEELDLPPPQLRGVVQKYETRQGVVWCRALVPTTGSRVSFQATDECGPGSLPKESAFLFCPTFEEDEKGYMIPALKDVDSVVVTHRATAEDDDEMCQRQEQEMRELCSHTELAPGFYSLGEELTRFLAKNFGVEGTPYEGGDISYADYCGGGELIRHLLADREQGRSTYDLPMKALQEAMIKLDSCSRASSASPVSEEATQAVLDRGILHLVVPKAENLSDFYQYIAREMKLANEEETCLRVLVGVLVDEEATPECLYNTEDCPFFDHYKYPWARNFCLLDGQYSLEHFDQDYSTLVPDIRSTAGKKLLLVSLDSRCRESGSLPMPQVLKYVAEDADADAVIEAEGNEEKEVILGFDKQDPRALSLIRNSGASTYRISGGCHLVSLPFADSEKAQRFVGDLRSEYTDVFCMTKENLYSPSAFTLTCQSPVPAHELYPLLDAVEIMPLGRHRYRFTCVHDIMDCAQVLWKENKYKKSDQNRFLALRDDQNHYVWLNRKKLELQKYFRRLPPARKAREAQPASRRLHWYSVEGLPRGVSDEMLRAGLAVCKQLLHVPVQEWRIDRSPYHPTVWVGLEAVLSDLNPVVKGAFRTVAMIFPGTEPAVGARPLGEMPDSADPLQVLRKFGRSDFYVPAKGTSKFLQRYAKKPKPSPARNSVFAGRLNWAQMAGSGGSNGSRKAAEKKAARGAPTENAGEGKEEPSPAGKVPRKGGSSSSTNATLGGRVPTRNYWTKDHKEEDELPSSVSSRGQRARDQGDEWKQVLSTGRKAADKKNAKKQANNGQLSTRGGDGSRAKGTQVSRAKSRTGPTSTKRRRRGSGAKDQETTLYQILQRQNWGKPGPARPPNNLQRPRDVILPQSAAAAITASSPRNGAK